MDCRYDAAQAFENLYQHIVAVKKKYRNFLSICYDGVAYILVACSVDNNRRLPQYALSTVWVTGTDFLDYNLLTVMIPDVKVITIEVSKIDKKDAAIY